MPAVVDPAATAEIVVRPVRNGSPDVQYVEIREVFTRSSGTKNDNLVVQVPEPPPGAAATGGLEVVEMVDADGPVAVRADSGGARRWRAQRSVAFPVTVTFKARMWPPGTRTNPSPMLRTAGGAVSGQGAGIFVTPIDGVNYAARFRWDLTDLAPGSVTTSGLTDENDVRAPIQTLANTFFMAGPLHRYPATGDRDGFAAYWHGTTRWDGARDMAWVASMYEYMRTFWKETTPRRYRVMGRMLPPPAYGGTALNNHFIFNAPAASYDTADVGPLLLLTHEAGHLFVRGLQNPGGGGPSNNWFSEGLNEYYAISLALRSGLAPLDLVLNEMNTQTRNYFTNPRKNMPADSVAMNNPLTDVMAQNISYERGTLFWAEMDARIRAASEGRRSLDDVIIPLVARSRQSGAGNLPGAQPQPGWFTPDELVDSLVKAAGPSARALFDSVVVRGKNIIPVANAFGPCFELRPAKYQGRYLGSNAARMAAVGQPPAPDIDAYLWQRVASVPEARCRKW
jgi:predicted metalloprotease with PDZ domain